MVFSELALGYITNLLYDSSKKVPDKILGNDSKIYDKVLDKFSYNNYKVGSIQIDTYFHQESVEATIKKYLRNPDKSNCLKILVDEFFELFNEENFSREDVDLIFNTFFETIDSEIEKNTELRDYLKLYLAKQTNQLVQETHETVEEVEQVALDTKQISKETKEVSQETYEVVQKIYGEIQLNKSVQDDNFRKELDTDFEEAIRKYLYKIISEDGKIGISEVYTELSAKEILPITLKFHDEQRNEPQDYEVLELVKKEERLIISGESGSGKTTTLKWLNVIYATNCLEKREENIPLYIELNSYIKGSFYDYIRIRAKGRGIEEDTLKILLEGKAIILLDGFDLLSPTENFYPYDEISLFISEYSDCRFVISSRPSFFESIKSGFKVSELEQLTDEKIITFVDKYVPDEKIADIVKDKFLINVQLKPLLRNPMLLYLTIKVAMGKKDNVEDLLPTNRSEMYEAFVSGLFSHYLKTKGKTLCADRVQIENALTDLYFKLQCRNNVSCKYKEALVIVKEHANDNTFRKTTSQDILEDSFKLGLLKRKGSEVEYGIHQSFQEYFAAIKLKELFESGFDISVTYSHPRWEEVVIFASEMLDSVDDFTDSMLSKSEIFLASKCADKASEIIKGKLNALLVNKMESKYKLEKLYSIESLHTTGVADISILITALKDEDRDVRSSVVRALGNIKSEETVGPLIQTLRDNDGVVRWYAAEALGNFKSKKVMKLLIEALKHEESDVRISVAITLGIIRSDETVQPLIEALKDKVLNVRWYVIDALGNFKSEKAVKLLIEALKHEDSDVRSHVAEALGNIKSEEAVQPLIEALKHEDEQVRTSVVRALGNIKSEEAVQPLIETLKHEDGEIRNSVAEALGNFKSEKVVKLLIEALKDEDVFARLRVTEAFEYIRSKKAEKLLIEALKDEDILVRFSVVIALGNIKSEKAVQPLIEMLNEDSDVRSYVAEALGNIKSEKAVQPLIEALSDEDSDVRSSVAVALGNIKSEKAVKPLIKALKDENEYVRSSVARALGNLKSEEAVQPLIEALSDEDSDVRSSVAEALGNIKSEEAVQPLIEALKHEDEQVRTSVVRALVNIKSEEAVQPLIEALKHRDWEMRNSVEEALGDFKSEKAVQSLIEALKDENEYVRSSAAKALGNVKLEKAVQPLIQTLNDENRYVRNSVVESLGNIKSEKAVQPLIEALKDENEHVRSSAAKALGKICTIKNKEQLEDLLESKNKFLYNAVFEILYKLEREERSRVALIEAEDRLLKA